LAQRVYLHIGLPKTGTTFLQTTMWHNRAQLEQQGFLYPGNRRMDHYFASQVVRGTPPEKLGSAADAWDRLRSELAAWPGTGLVSHEFFCLATRRAAHRAVRDLQPAEVHLVLTVRDYQRQFPAVWQEALKMNSDLSFDEFMESVLTLPAARRRARRRSVGGGWGWRSQDIPAVLERWGGTVPASRIHVVTVPPPDAPRSLLWTRWCQMLGLDDSTFDHDVHYANESLGAAQAALLQRVKPHLTGELNTGTVRHRWVRRYFGHEVLVPQGGARFAPRTHHAARLRELSKEAAEAVATGGYDVTGAVADLVPAELPPVDGPHPDDVPESELLEVAAKAFDRMIHDVKELTEANDALRSQLEHRSPRRRATRAKRLLRRALRRGVRRVPWTAPDGNGAP
jgi:hypothetical protein